MPSRIAGAVGLLLVLVAGCGPGQVGGAGPAGYLPFGAGPADDAQTTRCAMVFADDQHLATPVRSFCPVGSAGRSCAHWLGGDFRCDRASETWYQDAIYFAADRDADGFARGSGALHRRVYFSPGVVRVTRPLAGHWPFAPAVGVHVPGGVHVAGAPLAAGETIFAPADCPKDPQDPGRCLHGDHKRLAAMFLLSDWRRGPAGKSVLEAPPVADGSISNLTIVGTATAADAQPDTSCSPADQASVFLDAGILAGSASGGISIQDVRIRHVHGNAINLGQLIQWVQASPPRCSGGWCTARRLMFDGRVDGPNRVRWNHICDARFGGVVIVGSNTAIRDNSISVSWQPWTSGSFGVTMGISAGFVGTTGVTVEGNAIRGADYGIGSDGSFPLYLTVGLFQQHWSEIVAALGSGFQQAYPGGVPLDSAGQLAFLQGTDHFVKAQQVLLDLASRHHAGTADHLAGFVQDLRLVGNTISDVVTGVAVYRGRRVYVGRNDVSRGGGGGLNRVGVHIDESHDCYVYDNRIRGFGTGVLLSGPPGGRTRWGASFNGVGLYKQGGGYPEAGNTLTDNARGIVFADAGHDNAARRNTVTGSAPACDYSGARPNTSGNDWTTDNVPAQCNADY